MEELKCKHNIGLYINDLKTIPRYADVTEEHIKDVCTSENVIGSTQKFFSERFNDQGYDNIVAKYIEGHFSCERSEVSDEGCTSDRIKKLVDFAFFMETVNIANTIDERIKTETETKTELIYNKDINVYEALQTNNPRFKFQLPDNTDQTKHLKDLMNTDGVLFKNTNLFTEGEDGSYNYAEDSSKKFEFRIPYEAMKAFFINVYEASKKVRSIVNFRLKYSNTETDNKDIDLYTNDIYDNYNYLTNQPNFRTYIDQQQIQQNGGAAPFNRDLLMGSKLKELTDEQLESKELVKLIAGIKDNTLPYPNILDDSKVVFGQEKQNYGNFKQILNGEIEKYNFMDDYNIAKVNKNAKFIYAGYGYSGSGKTHTLIKDPKSILNQIIDANYFLELKLQVLDLYGEINDNNDETYTKTIYYTYTNNTVNKTDSSSESIEFNGDKKKFVSTFYDKLTEFRKDAANYSTIDSFYDKSNKKETAKFRVRTTPNNPESSRSHLFIKVFVGDDLKYTIIDMGGSENVDQIQSDYFELKPLYNITQFTTDVKSSNDTISTFSQSIDSNHILFTNKINKLETNKQTDIMTYKGNNETKNIVTIPKLEHSDRTSNAIYKDDAWNHFIQNTFQNDTYKAQVNEHYTTFKFNTKMKTLLNEYNVWILITNLITTVSKTIKNGLYGSQGTNTMVWSNITKIIDTYLKTLLSHMSNFEYLTLKYIINSDTIPDDFVECFYIENNKLNVLSDTGKVSRIPKDSFYINSKYLNGTIKKKLESVDRIDPQFLQRANEKLYTRFVAKYNNLASSNNTDNSTVYLTTNYIDNIKIVKKLLAMIEENHTDTTSFIEKYHYPLRYQGNFITKSIESFKKLASIINAPVSNSNSNSSDKILSKITELLDLKEKDGSKLVVFTCMRLDKYSKTTGSYTPVDDNERQYANNKESIENSLQFAHCINPVRQMDESFFDCEPKQGGSGKRRGSKRNGGAAVVVPQYNNPEKITSDNRIISNSRMYTPPLPQIHLEDASMTKPTSLVGPHMTPLITKNTSSPPQQEVHPLTAYPVKPVRNEVVYFAQQMGFIYVLKFMRWGFHYKQSKRDFTNDNERNNVMYNNILIDYIVTMMVAIGVYATNNHTLFYAILLDAILSILMYLRTKDEEILLVPYFLVFYGIDYLK